MVEQYMRSLKLGAMAKRWREVTFTSPEQYICELMQKRAAEIVGGFLTDYLGEEMKPWQGAENAATAAST